MLVNLKYDEIEWGKSIELPSSRALRLTTHIIGGKYPCRSIALIPRMILDEFESRSKPIKVLDPFMGSGTTAIEACIKGHIPYGLEVDPYARLISNLSVHIFEEEEIQQIEIIKNKIVGAFESCKINKELAPAIDNINYWFSEENYTDLLKLKTLIYKNTIKSESIRQFFLAVLADIVRASSKAERQSLKPYISTRFAKKNIPVLPSYEKSFEAYFSATKQAAEKLTHSKINWLSGDATKFSSSIKMDVAITSPPYINAMDYVRCIKLESAWVGTGNEAVFSNLRNLQKEDPQRFETALVYFQDMHDNLVSVQDALKSGSSYHLIVGNSVIRNVDVPTHEIIAKIGEKLGYTWEKYVRYPIKDHRTSLPRNGRGGKISEEHVISLRKA
jgi:DNA modification methylase